MTCTGEELLAAILADPADDNARLVYADWLQEEGFAGRAEFIRDQVAHPKGHIEVSYSGSNHRPYWKVRVTGMPKRKGITKAIRDSMVPAKEVTDKTTLFLFRRGFLDRMHCQWETWQEQQWALLRRHPIRTVILTTRTPFGRAYLTETGSEGVRLDRELQLSELKERWPKIEFGFVGSIPVFPAYTIASDPSLVGQLLGQ